MNIRLSLAPFLCGIAMLSASALGQDSTPALTAQVVPGGGALVLEVSGAAPAPSAWLSVQFLAPGQDSTGAAAPALYSVRGEFRLPVPVPDGCERGSYAVALWKERVAEGMVSTPQGLRAYGRGGIATGPEQVKLADSLADLVTGMSTRDGRKVLKVSGHARESRWLAVVFYRPGVADSTGVTLSIPKGDFSPEIAVPTGYEGGSYAASLWARFGTERRALRLSGEIARAGGQIAQ